MGELGDVYLELGDLARAAHYNKLAVDAAMTSSGDHLSGTLMQRSALRLVNGQAEEARVDAEQAVRLARTAGVDQHNLADTLMVTATVHLSLGRHTVARALLLEATELMLQLGYRLPFADTMSALGLVQQALGDNSTAIRLLGAASGLRERTGLALMYGHMRTLHEQAVSLLIAEQGRAAFNTLWQEGRDTAVSIGST